MQVNGRQIGFMGWERVDSTMGMSTQVIMVVESDKGKADVISPTETCMWEIGRMILFMGLEDTITTMGTGKLLIVSATSTIHLILHSQAEYFLNGIIL